MFRYSLAGFLLFVALIGVACAAIANPIELWRQIVATVVLVMLLLATLTAVFGRGSSSRFAGGLAVAGWLYFALTFLPMCNLRYCLLTEDAVQLLQVAVLDDETQPPRTIAVRTNNLTFPDSDMGKVWLWDVSTTPAAREKMGRFHDIGHGVWTILVGFLGGIFVVWLRRSRGESPAGSG